LEAEIEKLKQSVAIGLADGYYWNFINNVARTFEMIQMDERSYNLTIEKSRDEKFETNLGLPFMTVFLPNQLDLRVDDVDNNQIVEFSKQLTQNQKAYAACLKLGGPNNFRP
jgi:hypothetical protein